MQVGVDSQLWGFEKFMLDVDLADAPQPALSMPAWDMAVHEAAQRHLQLERLSLLGSLYASPMEF